MKIAVAMYPRLSNLRKASSSSRLAPIEQFFKRIIRRLDNRRYIFEGDAYERTEKISHGAGGSEPRRSGACTANLPCDQDSLARFSALGQLCQGYAASIARNVSADLADG